MIQLKRLLVSFGSLFSGEGSPESDDKQPEMSVLPVSANEKVAYKLKGYFDLATTEIDKAVRAEEWGLVDDAIAHYNNASVILAEAKATRSPAFLSASEVDKVQKHQEKIRTWEEKVLDRLQVLNRRKGLTAPTSNLPSKTISVPVSTRRVASPHPKASIPQKSTSSVNRVTPQSPSTVRSTNGTSGSSRSTQEANGQDPKLVETIESLIVDKSPSVKWDDVAGLDKAKQALLEMVILPIKRRDLFTGLRKPARGLLLFGPPGNGKTMLAKAVASESAATFFSVSASSLTSKWVGEGEKLMRALFAVAVARQPSVIFIDEIDSIMSAREANENEASRRLKSEFLVQFDGLTSNAGDLVIVIGATNKPQELDDAVLRRLVKRIYIPLPDETVRRILLKHNLKGPAFSLPDHEIERIVQETEGYSGSDLQALCEEAALMPIRELGSRILKVNKDQVRPLRYQDFRDAMEVIRPSLLKSKWEELERWNQQFGSN